MRSSGRIICKLAETCILVTTSGSRFLSTESTTTECIHWLPRDIKFLKERNIKKLGNK